MQAIPAAPRLSAFVSGNRALKTFLVVYSLVMLVSLAGIATRPMDSFATFWPANAVLLGFFIRKRAYASSIGWVAAFLGYITADFLTGGTFRFTLVLALANLAGVAPAYLIFQRLPAHIRDIKQPMSLLGILFVAMCGAATATISAAMIANEMLDGSAIKNALYWFCSELTNFIIILPLMLTFPEGFDVRKLTRRRISLASVEIHDMLPVLALILSMIIGIIIGGPGSIAFPIPALIWCALRYSIFATATTVLLVGIWEMFAITSGLAWIFNSNQALDTDVIISVRLGIALMALAPLAVSISNESRLTLIARLDQAANQDELTGLPNRRAFMTWGQERIIAADNSTRGIALLMIDLDRFKAINDTYGHVTGDRALRHFATIAVSNLRDNDLLCRWGGEEFAVLLLDIDQATATQIAGKILEETASNPVRDPEGQPMQITVSIGLVWLSSSENACMISLLHAADNALYAAKDAGRNRLVIADSVPPLTHQA